ncbi:hypothetical protein PoB_007377000 [Plakobranchus ocellatus]|uniref:Uncharacterized protein n=1 Tax=Plakobranchus ocellatus TaxID=259542 RepID=A0AAV4DT96_9GAST|nr:hypothetical protein PoB_007377000 [Plakobranchus ocellatus]
MLVAVFKLLRPKTTSTGRVTTPSVSGCSQSIQCHSQTLLKGERKPCHPKIRQLAMTHHYGDSDNDNVNANDDNDDDSNDYSTNNNFSNPF